MECLDCNNYMELEFIDEQGIYNWYCPNCGELLESKGFELID